jgi:hypothetical protein
MKYPEELLAERVKELEADKALMVQTFGNIMDDRALAYAGLSLEKLVASIDALEAENERLREALREIEDMCPVTCDMTLAHAMADTARAALAGKAEQ